MKLPYIFRDTPAYKPAKFLGRVVAEVVFKDFRAVPLGDYRQRLVVDVVRRKNRSMAIQFRKEYKGGIHSVSIKSNHNLLLEYWEEIVALAVVEEL